MISFLKKYARPLSRALFSCLLLLLTQPASAETLPLEQLIVRMQQVYEQTADIKARFIQEVTIKAMKKTDREEGTAYFKNPGRMLWSYEKPKPKKLIVNPNKSWLYVPEDHVVYMQNATSILKSKLTMRFFSGMGKLSEDFQVSFCQPQITDNEGHYCLVLIPKDTSVGVGKLILHVHKDSFQILQCQFSDTYGNTTRIRFREIKLNNTLSDQMFDFKPPAGVEVVNVP